MRRCVPHRSRDSEAAIEPVGLIGTLSRMIIRHVRAAATPEDEKACLDERRWSEETSVARRYKGRGLIGGLTPNDNLTRRRLTYT